MTDRTRPRVIAGVDGSYGSLAALRVALTEARQRGWPLVVAHVIPWVSIEKGWDVARQQGHDLVTDCIQNAFGSVPRDVEMTNTTVEQLAPGPGLIHLSNPDSLIVVGARLTRRVWRSGVDTYLIRHAPCPVLTVPAPPMLRLMSTRKERRDWQNGLDSLADLAASG